MMRIVRSQRSPRRLLAHLIRPFALVLTLAVTFAGMNFFAPQSAAVHAAPPDPAAPDIAERYQPDRIRWQPCPENQALECGTLRLPVDYNKLRGETFDMAVIRAKVTDPSKRIGVLMALPGGPGQSGVNFVLGGIQLGAPIIARLRERFDLVSFDPRGVARSHPATCNLEPAGQPPQDAAALVTFFDDFSRRVAQACFDQHGPFVLSMSTNNIVRDVDTLRRSLSEKQVSIYGGSYGSVTGSAYVSRFPQRVRALVLDGGVAPDFSDYWVEWTLEQAQSFELTLRYVDQRCQRDQACTLHDSGVVATLDAVIARLQAEPVPAPDGTTLTATDVQNVTAALLYNEQQFPLLVQALTNARDGDYARFFELLPATRSLIRLALTTATFDAYDITICNDYGTRRSAAETLPVDEASALLMPHFWGRFYLAGEVARCAAWPAADPPVIRNVQHRLATPIMLVGNHFDPATPLNWTRRLAGRLGMDQHIVRYQGGGHLAATKNIRCIDDVVVPYLFDLKLPPPNYSCAARPIRFAPPASDAREQQADQIEQFELWSERVPRVR